VTPEQYELVREAFLQARSLAPEAIEQTLAAMLEAPELREMARDLIAEDRDTAGFLEHDPLESLKGSAPTMGPAIGSMFQGRYRIERELGRGGMGVVFLAQQSAPVERSVAIKLLRAGWPSDQWMRRFDLERQALASLTHPGIARMYDAGVTIAGAPYVVMEHIDGPPITTFCDENNLSIHGRIDLFLKVCAAVQYAHQRGFLHRDLKPSNILVRSDQGQATPVVIDFGIAKAISDLNEPGTLMTTEGQMLGTPGYMSPEQAAGDTDLIDTRSDIYSLGVILYELLTGALPDEPARHHTVSRVGGNHRPTNIDPLRPSTRIRRESEEKIATRRGASTVGLARRISGDLDWITMKALERDPGRRYASVSEFADDLRRHLAGQPVLAGPPTVFYRISKFTRRNAPAVIAAALILLALVGGLIGTSAGFIKADRERAVAEQSQRDAESVSEFLTGVFESPNLWEQGRGVTMLEAMRIAEPKIAEHFAGAPLQEALVRHTLGETFSQFSEFDLAEPNLRRAYELRRDLLGESNENTLNTMSNLSWLYGNMAQYEMALSLGERAAGESRRELGDDHEVTLAIANNLARVYLDLGRTEDAVQLFRFAVEAYRRTYGVDHPFTLTAEINLALALRSAEQYEEMITLAEHVLDLSATDGAGDLRSTLVAESIVAVEMFRKRDIEDGIEAILDLLPRVESALGENSLDTIQLLSLLGGRLNDVGRGDEGLPFLKSAYERSIVRLGWEHPTTLDAGIKYAIALSRWGKQEESARVAEELLPLHVQVFGETHDRTMALINNMGQNYRRMDDYENAEKHMKRALELRTQIAGFDSEPAFSSRNSLASLYVDQEQYEEAEEILWPLLEAHIELLGPEHWKTLAVQANLARVLSRQDKWDEAVALRWDTAEKFLRAHGPEYRPTILAWGNLADTLLAAERPEEAEEPAMRAYEMIVAMRGEVHSDTWHAMEYVERVYRRTGREELADEWQARIDAIKAELAAKSSENTPRDAESSS
jgi:serine/threonine protein kinase/tetratricopeptide (TPR) repeat protein